MIGRKLKLLREERNLTHEQLAEILEISKKEILSYENNGKEPGFVAILKMCNFFDIEVQELDEGSSMSNVSCDNKAFTRTKLFELKGDNVEIINVGTSKFGGIVMHLRSIKTEDVYALELSARSIENPLKDCVLENFNDVNFSKIKAGMIVIYDHPRDYRWGYVARIWDMDRPTNFVVADKDIGILRGMIPKNMNCIGRYQDDDPCIVEVWL